MKISDSVKYIGVNDHVTDLFEGQYKIKNGISYNSYIILDDKIAVMDTVDQNFTHEWLDKVADALNGRKPDYLIIQHMEPDHSANIANFMSVYPETTVVASAKAFLMMKQFFGTDFSDNRKEVGEGDSIDLGHRTLTFVTAPMVHWPEVIVTYDSKDKILFSADGFGKFGALDANEPWEDEARRYYIGIVGKYGKQVQALLKKAASLDIKMICPLHGPVLTENLGHYIGLYDIWSSYSVEKDGIVIAYTSIYGHTAKAVSLLEEKLRVKGCPEVHVFDLARCDISEAVARAFSCGKLVLATTTYNAGIFPHMRNFIEQLTERGYKNRTVALIENGSWAPLAIKVMKRLLEDSENISYTDTSVTIRSALDGDSGEKLEALADELCREYIAQRSETADKTIFPHFSKSATVCMLLPRTTAKRTMD